MIHVSVGQIKDQNLIRSIIAVIACQNSRIPVRLLSLHLSGQNYPEEIQFGLSDDEVLANDITEPIYAGMNSGKIDDFVKQLQNVTAAGVLAVHATEEDIAKYGLDNPVAVCDYTMNDEHHVIKLGDKTGDLYSMMVDDDTTIYTITDSAVTSWVNIEVYSLRDGFVRLPYIKSVSRVTLTSSTGTDVYDVTRIENEEKSTETNTFYDLEVSKDGKEINYDYYQPFYQMLLAISVLNEEIQEPQGDPILTIKYDFFDGRKSEEIKFYADPASERRAVATLNDQPTGSVRMSDIQKILEAKDLFMIGRGLDYSILLEGSLKLKEVSYIHSEAYASGELKHGPIALITTNTPVVATVTQEKLMSKELSNIKEVKSRGADIVLFIKEALSGDLDTEYQVIRLPNMQDEFMVLPASVALQLLAYYVSSDKGFDVDKPRNLAKVVTVE